MNKKDLIVALCKKNDYVFNEVSMIDMTHSEYFQLVFPTPDEEKINSMNEVNYLIDFLENLILETEKEFDKKFNSEIYLISDSKLIFGGWKQETRLIK
jgi:hypothetical protein